jgi:CheY-like chemotaxis protein
VDTVRERLESGAKMFDLILMDIHMPVMDGLEASQRIAGMGVATPIVAITANVMSNDIEHYKAIGMSDCLPKPFTSQELWRCLVKYIPIEQNAADISADEDEKLQNKYKLDFARNSQNLFAELRGNLGGGDIKTAHRMVHTLKGNAGQIGEPALQAIAAKVEVQLKDGVADESEMDVLKVELDAVLARLEPLMDEYRLFTEQNKPEMITETEKIREIIARLEPLLYNKNPGCEDMLGEICAIPGTEELAQHIDKFRFKQALEELEKLKDIYLQ